MRIRIQNPAPQGGVGRADGGQESASHCPPRPAHGTARRYQGKSRVPSQHPPTQWNLGAADEAVLNTVHEKNPKNPPLNIILFCSQCFGSALVSMWIWIQRFFYLNADPDLESQTNADPVSQKAEFLHAKYTFIPTKVSKLF
jgi:hypothetical protein